MGRGVLPSCLTLYEQLRNTQHQPMENNMNNIEEAENRQLRDEIKHLMGCKEFESNLQKEIIQVGSDFMDEVISGKTYSVEHAWRAIQQALKGDK